MAADKDPWHTLAEYERRLWHLLQDNQAQREMELEYRRDLIERERRLLELDARREERTGKEERLAQQVAALSETRTQLARDLDAVSAAWDAERRHLMGKLGWAIASGTAGLKARLAPSGTPAEHGLNLLFGLARARSGEAAWHTGRDLFQWIEQQVQGRVAILGRDLRRRLAQQLDRHVIAVSVPPIVERGPAGPHRASVDIVICVHNALADVRRCLDSVLRHTAGPFSLILVDDGSTAETAGYLAEFSGHHGAVLLRSETATGYTRAANRGLRRSTAEHVVLLNSDTLVTPGWLDRLVACAETDPATGLAGPLSNTASWQSIPEVAAGGDWADNQLPPGVGVDDMGRLVERYSGRLYPHIPFLNGFCLLIRRQVLDAVGIFDEETFGEGYGEENDYCLRARKAGFSLRVADDAYVYHAQSRSYSHERRRKLCERADAALPKKHDPQMIAAGVAFCQHDRVLLGIRARSRTMAERQRHIEEGRRAFSGRQVLVLLPTNLVGGGANVILREVRAMREMGVDATVFNLLDFRAEFERCYPRVDVPLIYGTSHDISRLASEYDALVGTHNLTIEWLADIAPLCRADRPVFGYYIQDFEPYFYPPGSELFHSAFRSYRAFPELVRFTKTEWNRREIEALVGVECAVVGPSFDVDLFRPRPRRQGPGAPLRVAAMIRPYTPYRAPRLTMEVLEAMSRRFGAAIEIVLFGCTRDDPKFVELPRKFPCRLAGLLDPHQMANLLNEADIFVDFSSHQAMGLTSLEAMACGAAVVVPECGGSASFARPGDNCLVTDTASRDACQHALEQLIADDDLRQRLSRRAIGDVSEFFPERPALRILYALFG